MYSFCSSTVSVSAVSIFIMKFWEIVMKSKPFIESSARHYNFDYDQICFVRWTFQSLISNSGWSSMQINLSIRNTRWTLCLYFRYGYLLIFRKRAKSYHLCQDKYLVIKIVPVAVNVTMGPASVKSDSQATFATIQISPIMLELVVFSSWWRLFAPPNLSCAYYPSITGWRRQHCWRHVEWPPRNAYIWLYALQVWFVGHISCHRWAYLTFFTFLYNFQ